MVLTMKSNLLTTSSHLQSFKFDASIFSQNLAKVRSFVFTFVRGDFLTMAASDDDEGSKR